MNLHSIAIACVTLVLFTGCDSASEDAIGPEGGVVVSRDGRFTLDIPEGALDEAVDITIEEVEDLPEDALGPAYRVLPLGTVFNAPVHVLYAYEATGMDVDPDEISLVVERGHHDWSVLADRHVFEDEGIVSASALYLSTFCVIEDR